MSRSGRKLKRKRKKPVPCEPGPATDFAPIQGYMKRGPDYSEARQGWWVYALPTPGADVPVTLTTGHVEG